MDRVEPAYATLRRLKEHVRTKNSTCLKGFFIDFIECTNPQVSAVVDIAAKQKLFCAIVDEMKDAQELLQMNKDIKGGVINIYTIETLNQVELKRLPEVPAEAKSLLNFVRVKPEADQRLQKLVSNIFGKVAMVRDYESALRIAKENGLTCVTPELQVVYAGAFITKVGSQGRTANNTASNLSRLNLYQKISSLSLNYQKKQAEAEQLQNAKVELAQSDLEAMRELQKSETRLQQLKQQLSETGFAKMNIDAQLSTRSAKEEEYKGLAARYEQVVGACDEKIKKLNEEKKVNSGTDFAFEDRDQARLLYLNKEITKLGLEVSERTIALQQVRAGRDAQRALVENCYLKKQT